MRIGKRGGRDHLHGAHMISDLAFNGEGKHAMDVRIFVMVCALVGNKCLPEGEDL
jgi:hypothetical protein